MHTTLFHRRTQLQILLQIWCPRRLFLLRQWLRHITPKSILLVLQEHPCSQEKHYRRPQDGCNPETPLLRHSSPLPPHPCAPRFTLLLLTINNLNRCGPLHFPSLTPNNHHSRLFSSKPHNLVNAASALIAAEFDGHFGVLCVAAVVARTAIIAHDHERVSTKIARHGHTASHVVATATSHPAKHAPEQLTAATDITSVRTLCRSRQSRRKK